ncbi:MAG: 4Fe-4S binding protein [Collinsella intestinalis]
MLNGGKLAIEPTYCIGCGLCAEVCPTMPSRWSSAMDPSSLFPIRKPSVRPSSPRRPRRSTRRPRPRSSRSSAVPSTRSKNSQTRRRGALWALTVYNGKVYVYAALAALSYE